MNLLHLSETGFLWLFGPITGGLLIGTWLSGRAASRFSNDQTVMMAYVLMVLSVLGNLIFHLFHAPELPWSVLPLVFYVIGSSLAMPSLTLMALDLFPSQRGMASSCQSFVQSGGNALVTAIVAPLLWGSALTLAYGQLVMLGIGVISYAAYRWMRPSSGDAGPSGDKHAVGVEFLRPEIGA